MKKLYLKSARDLKKMGKRGVTVLLILGLCIGFVLAMFYMPIDLPIAIRGLYDDANSADYTYESAGFNSSFLEDVSQIDGVEDSQGKLIIQLPLEIEGREERLQLLLVGVDTTNFDADTNLDIYSYEMAKGNNIQARDGLSIVLSNQFVENNDEINVGETLVVDALGDTELEIEGSFFSMEYLMLNTLPDVLWPIPGTMGVAIIDRAHHSAASG